MNMDDYPTTAQLVGAYYADLKSNGIDEELAREIVRHFAMEQHREGSVSIRREQRVSA